MGAFPFQEKTWGLLEIRKFKNKQQQQKTYYDKQKKSDTNPNTWSGFYEILDSRFNLSKPANHWLPGVDQSGWEKHKRRFVVMETFCILPVVPVHGCIYLSEIMKLYP